MTRKRDKSDLKEISLITTCRECNAVFPSRNALFRHLNSSKCGNIADSRNSRCDLSNDNETESSCGRTIQERLLTAESSSKSFVVVTGGRLRGKTLLSCERYNVLQSKWESFTNMLENRGSHGVAVIDRTLYAVGGGGLSSNLSSCEKIVMPHSKNWEYFASMNTKSPRHALSVIAHNSRIYAIGGWCHGSTCTGEMEIYDTEKDLWSIGPSLNVPRRLLSTTVWKGRILVAIGGCCVDGDWNSSAVETFDCDDSSPAKAWIRKPDAPLSGQTSAATIYNDLVYVFFHGLNKVYEYNPESEAWRCIVTLPIPDWSCFQTVIMEQRFIFCIGGASRGKWLNKVWVLDALDNSWWELPSMKTPRRRAAAALLTCE
jgi:N-acetylneuraminic acid mutarotase